MKTKLSLLCAIFFGMTCYAQIEYSPKDLTNIFNSHLSDFTNSIPVATGLIFHLTSNRYGSYPATQFKSDETINYGLLQTPVSLTKTNIINFYRIPYNQTFDFHLFDKLGRAVEKTKDGRAMSQPVNPTKYGRSMEDHRLGRDVGNLLPQGVKNNDDLHTLFRPDDIFVITNKGIYNLSIGMRICVPMTNGVVDTNALTDWRAFARARTFGVVESPPLYVKVIKE